MVEVRGVAAKAKEKVVSSGIKERAQAGISQGARKAVDSARERVMRGIISQAREKGTVSARDGLETYANGIDWSAAEAPAPSQQVDEIVRKGLPKINSFATAQSVIESAQATASQGGSNHETGRAFSNISQIDPAVEPSSDLPAAPLEKPDATIDKDEVMPLDAEFPKPNQKQIDLVRSRHPELLEQPNPDLKQAIKQNFSEFKDITISLSKSFTSDQEQLTNEQTDEKVARLNQIFPGLGTKVIENMSKLKADTTLLDQLADAEDEKTPQIPASPIHNAAFDSALQDTNLNGKPSTEAGGPPGGIPPEGPAGPEEHGGPGDSAGEDRLPPAVTNGPQVEPEGDPNAPPRPKELEEWLALDPEFQKLYDKDPRIAKLLAEEKELRDRMDPDLAKSIRKIIWSQRRMKSLNELLEKVDGEYAISNKEALERSKRWGYPYYALLIIVIALGLEAGILKTLASGSGKA